MSRQKQESDFLKLAGRIADGDPIDWRQEEERSIQMGGGDDDLKGLFNLRALDSISKVHRQVIAGEELPFRSWGCLDVQEQIGRGGFGEVYKAWDRNLSRTVALKLLPDDPADPLLADLRFVEEARTLAGVQHANVVTIHGVDRHSNRSGLWMEWLDGDNLGSAVHNHGPFGAREAALIGMSACQALAAVHRAGLVHRDVKLSNLFRERGGRIVLMDFGSSTRQSDKTAFDDLNHVSGTPLYLPPECFEGDDSRERLDIYSLGVTLYALSSGEYPVRPGTLEEIRDQHRSGESIPLRDHNPDLPVEFIQLVHKAMSPDPADRYQSVGEMEQDLSSYLGNVPVSDNSKPEPGPPLRALPFLAAAAVLIVATITLFYILPMFTGFDADSALYLSNPARETSTRLEQGSRIQVGDVLFAELDLGRRSHVYIINEDSHGRQYLLFPVDGLEMTNPVPDGDNIRVPKNDGWVVDTGSGGEEIILIIVSRTAVPVVEDLIAGLEQPGDGVPIPLHRDMTTRLRGIGGLARPDPNDIDSVQGSIRTRLFRQAAEKNGVKIWEYRLRNSE